MMKSVLLKYFATVCFVGLFAFISPRFVQAQTPEELAMCLQDKGFRMYGKYDCPNCDTEKRYFGESFKYITYIECSQNRELCTSKNITGYPTWEDGNGKFYKGAIPLDILAQLSGCNERNASDIATQSGKTGVLSLLSTHYLVLIFLAGLLSFFAPCCLPLYPAYFSVITGFTFTQLYGLEFGHLRGRVFISSLFFIGGFVGIFTLLGAVSSLVGHLLTLYMPVFLRMSGVFLIVLGIIQLGIFKFHSLEFDYAWKIQRRLMHLGFITSLVTGVAAALSWIPCIGPLLAPVLLLASKSETALQGMYLLFIYGIGVTLPFFLGGLFFPTIFKMMQKYSRIFKIFSRVAGLIVIGFGGLLVFDVYRIFLDTFYRFVDPILIQSFGPFKTVVDAFKDYLLKFSI